MTDVILDTILDGLRLVPFLFLTYLAMEAITHKAGEPARRRIRNAGKLGPLLGSLLGVIPHGFSVAASGLYAGRIITLGTLMAIYLSTSEEMLPVLLSEQVAPGVIIKIICLKILIGVVSGYLVELVCKCLVSSGQRTDKSPVGQYAGDGSDQDMDLCCIPEHAHGKGGIFRPALEHTVKIFIYIFAVSLVLNVVIALVGEDWIGTLFVDVPVIEEMIAALVGMIPNCVSSVVITELYLDGVLSTGAMMAGLLVNTGAGLLVILRQNQNRRATFGIMAALYGLGVFWGTVINMLHITLL